MNPYDRVDIAINPDERFDNKPTPARLAAYRGGTLDHGLEQIYFNFGRYLLIASSRAHIVHKRSETLQQIGVGGRPIIHLQVDVVVIVHTPRAVGVVVPQTLKVGRQTAMPM